ncbi:hypothetical protein XS74_22995 [Salmonella enterica subsp. enterica]|nr:hypothetical protein [Salmonella enterica subsp. enterica]EDT7315851.1 transposase [Salmonella enterica subsp. enterica]
MDHNVNGVFRIRQPAIWGNATTTCAADSRKFGAYDQSLMTEWQARYGGRGVMIYWHVDTHSRVFIHTCAAVLHRRWPACMMEGVLRHCTDMEINRKRGCREFFWLKNIVKQRLLPKPYPCIARRKFPEN